MARKKKDSEGLPMMPVAIINQETTMELVQTLKPFPGNARKGDVDALAAIFRENGFIGFLVVNKRPGKYERVILVGNNRWLAACRVGLGSVPVVWVDVDDRRAEKINLADNRASDLASYDERMRLMQLRDLVTDSMEGEDLRGIGYDEEELERIRRIVEDPLEARGGGAPPKKVRILVQCTCEQCGNSWTGYIDEDANVKRVRQRGSSRLMEDEEE